MTCNKWQTYHAEQSLLEGDLSPEMIAHLSDCPSCRQQQADDLSLDRALSTSLPAGDVPADAIQSILNRIEEPVVSRSSQSWSTALKIAAIILFMAAVTAITIKTNEANTAPPESVVQEQPEIQDEPSILHVLAQIPAENDLTTEMERAEEDLLAVIGIISSHL